MVLLLGSASAIYATIGDTADALVTTLALLPVAAIGWLLESRAEHALERLRSLTAPTSIVWRDGTRVTVPVEELVRGDMIWVHEGDIIPADALAVELTQLTVDESALTGESLPVSKSAGEGVAQDDRTLFAGTRVLSGSAEAVITDTGASTKYGVIGSSLASGRSPATPLQRLVRRLLVRSGIVAGLFCAAVAGVELARGRGWDNALIAGVSLAIAAIPEEFPMVYTLYLALGAWRLARRGALVRHLPGVETLGSTTVICTDKTGTLTEGRLHVAELVPDEADDGNDLLEAAELACEPTPFDPLDLAITRRARELGLPTPADSGLRLVRDHPFDPGDKYLSHTWVDRKGRCVIAAKGSIEGILRHARAEEPSTRRALAENERLGALGMRVIAVASGELDGRAAPRDTTDDCTSAGDQRFEDETRLVFRGLVAFSDPVRDGVADALEQCRAAGIRVVVITGDHASTAHAVAELLAVSHTDGDGSDLIATGEDLDRCDDRELDVLVGKANVFARTRPEQKLRLVHALRRAGQVVAMTGDGINDAPALRDSDIGIAMGSRGTEVAREAATIVLADDNFATIVHSVRDGRRIFDNLTRAFAYLVAFHPPLLLAALVVPLVNRPLLLLPVHLVMHELLLHPVVSLVFEHDPADADVMTRPPRAAGQGLAGRNTWHALLLGVTLAAAVIGAYLWLTDRGWTIESARAFSLATLLIGQTVLLLVERSPHASLWRSPPRFTPLVTGVTCGLLLCAPAIVYVPPIAHLLKTESFALSAWPFVVVLALVSTLWSETFKKPVSG